jgi:hypothetical protein
MYFILNCYVIYIFKFCVFFEFLNSIKLIYCVNLIPHTIKFKIVKSKIEKLMWR